MLRFNLQLFLFLLVSGAAILLIPPDKEKMYLGLKNDCFQHSFWIYDRLWQNPAEADIAFIGSSQTFNSIDEGIIEQHFEGENAVNLGYCRHGRNLHLIMAEELIEAKDPKVLVLETGVLENPYSHPIAPYLADNKNFISSYPFFNKDLFKDYSLTLRFRIQLLQESLFSPDSLRQTDMSLHGYAPVTDTASVDYLKELRQQRETWKGRGWRRNLDLEYPMHYLERIAHLCEESGVKLYFLFLPAYAEKLRAPDEKEKLEQLGTLLLPPDSIFNNTDYWFDEAHLNHAGGQALSHWLGKELKKREGAVLSE